MLRFGSFLEYVIASGDDQHEILPNLTERFFRRQWSLTTGPSEEARFVAVLERFSNGSVVQYWRTNSPETKAIAQRIINACVDRKWRTEEQIAKKAGLEVDVVHKSLGPMKSQGAHQTLVETREFNDKTEYRIRKGSGKKIQLDVLLSEIEPLLKELEAEARKEHIGEYCPSAILHITFRLRKLLQERST
jgi:hypothetical protein